MGIIWHPLPIEEQDPHNPPPTMSADAWADDREANKMAAQDEQASHFAEYFPGVTY